MYPDEEEEVFIEEMVKITLPYYIDPSINEKLLFLSNGEICIRLEIKTFYGTEILTQDDYYNNVIYDFIESLKSSESYDSSSELWDISS